MTIHETRLVRRQTVAEGTMAFYFSKPLQFRHQAGQSVLVKLSNPMRQMLEGMSIGEQAMRYEDFYGY